MPRLTVWIAVCSMTDVPLVSTVSKLYAYEDLRSENDLLLRKCVQLVEYLHKLGSQPQISERREDGELRVAAAQSLRE